MDRVTPGDARPEALTGGKQRRETTCGTELSLQRGGYLLALSNLRSADKSDYS